VFANDYEDAWKALNRNDRKTALVLLQKAMNDPKTAVDAYVTYIYLQSFEGKESEVNDFSTRVYDKLKDANPYVFALWFNGSALGGYGKKAPGHQLQLLDRLLADPGANGSIKAAAHYFKALHYQFSNDFSRAEKEWAKIGAVAPVWQFVGPFDNLSGSGYYKDYGPLHHPEANANFTSVSSANIQWFTPPVISREGYTFPYPHIRRNTAIVYAQTFVYSPEDRSLLLNVGAGGSLKVWVNDRPVLGASKELVTEMDFYKQHIQLKKGYNRLLVQLGYTDNTSPNFIIRLTDETLTPVSGLTYSAQVQPYVKDVTAAGTTAAGGANAVAGKPAVGTASASGATTSAADAPPSIRHFAEAFFEKKVAAEPGNAINYLLLSDTYLRSAKTTEARKTIEDALHRYPDNQLLRLELMEVLIKEGNRTMLMEEAERMKEKDPDCILAIRLNIQRMINEEKYEDAFKELDRCVKLFGEDEQVWSTRMTLYSKQNKMDELVKTIQQAFAKYPENTEFVSMMYNLKVNGYKDARGGIKVLETYLKDNFSFSILKKLAAEYTKQGMKEKALALLQLPKTEFPYDPDLYTDISSFYYDQQNYDKAADFGRQALALAPYVATYWENLGLELQQLHKNADAIKAYQKALYYDANKYSARERLRELENKPSVWKAFPETDVYKAIRDAAGKTFNYDYFYVLDEKFAVVYPEGATEEYTTTVVKILDQKGIDTWKESTIGYNSNTQELKMEKAEVVKKSGSVVPAEQNENQVVFTGLEVGDAIVLKYKIQHYAQGRVARHYWDKFSFNAFVPELVTRYCLLIANNVKFDYKLENGSPKPAESNYDDFKLYTWQMNDPAIFKDEAFMPPLMDIGPVVHVSTLASWSDIATWYSDLSNSKTEDEFEVKQVYQNLFPQGADKLSDREKAIRIYRYITGNIHYSSVPFRQGAFIPQKASLTINTRLGDCKDLSSLFVALAKLSGLKANLVLVNTRDNGQKSMELPSVEFNHCVVKTWLNGQPTFLELTDNDLPFACLPPNLDHASCLVIPSGNQEVKDAKLEFVESPNRPRERINRQVNVRIDGSKVRLGFDVCKTGTLVSGVRDEYESLSPDKQLEEMQKAVSGSYKNTVKVDSVIFGNLGPQSDSVRYRYYCAIDNEVVEVGSMHMIKIPFTDVVASMDNFSPDVRQFPVEYWRYENTDEYNTKVNIQAPAGMQFIDLPKSESYTFKGSTYSIQYIPAGPRSLTIIRKATLQRDNVQPAEYKAMKDFFGKIVKAESKYIAFK
jgi:tetratricopeptide (TPR) repeat protein/transglutaminase-like putative cysteine protease